MTGDCVLLHAPRVLDYRLADEMVIYDPVTSQAASLNETAGMIWALCNGTRSLQAVCVEIAQRFGVPVEEVDASIHEGAERLCQLGLLCT